MQLIVFLRPIENLASFFSRVSLKVYSCVRNGGGGRSNRNTIYNGRNDGITCEALRSHVHALHGYIYNITHAYTYTHAATRNELIARKLSCTCALILMDREAKCFLRDKFSLETQKECVYANRSPFSKYVLNIFHH